MAKKITRTITFTRFKVATIGTEPLSAIPLDDVIIEGKISPEYFSKYTRDFVLSYSYERGTYEMLTSEFIKNAILVPELTEEQIKEKEANKGKRGRKPNKSEVI